jgi:uncharacterized protein (DUF1015 family)
MPAGTHPASERTDVARVRSFRAFRYASPSSDISRLTAPPYDVVSEEQRVALLERDRHNVVALELPEGALDPDSPDSRYATGAHRWEEWRAEGVVVQDPRPAIYVLEQRWQQGGEPARRLAFLAAVGLEDPAEGVILPHERTLPKALDDRLMLTRACAANFSPVFGLYPDPASQTAAQFAEAIQGEPIEYALGDDGVQSRLWRIVDSSSIDRLERFFADKPIFIADGHHRYSTALAYRDERRAASGGWASPPESDLAADVNGPCPLDDEPPFEFVMMALANMDDPDLLVLPTHRVADAAGTFDPEEFWRRLSADFEVEELPPGHPLDALSAEGEPRFVVQTRDGTRRLVRLKPEVDPDDAIDLPFSSAWKHLDVAILQELVLSRLLDIHPDRPETLERLSFVKDAHEALKVGASHDVVFVLRATRMEQLREVALSGETMPQKSTYFHPKMLSGLAIRSLA